MKIWALAIDDEFDFYYIKFWRNKPSLSDIKKEIKNDYCQSEKITEKDLAKMYEGKGNYRHSLYTIDVIDN